MALCWSSRSALSISAKRTCSCEVPNGLNMVCILKLDPSVVNVWVLETCRIRRGCVMQGGNKSCKYESIMYALEILLKSWAHADTSWILLVGSEWFHAVPTKRIANIHTPKQEFIHQVLIVFKAWPWWNSHFPCSWFWIIHDQPFYFPDFWFFILRDWQVVSLQLFLLPFPPSSDGSVGRACRNGNITETM